MVALPSLFEADLSNVDAALEDFCRHSAPEGSLTQRRATALWDDVMASAQGGKRLRPRLLLLAAGANPPEAAPAVAAAYSLLHAAFVLHDDIIDRDDQRHGRPAVHASSTVEALNDGWPADQAPHRGNSRALLAGDLAINAAYSLMITCTRTLPSEARERLLDLLQATVFATTIGELLDVELAYPPADGGVSSVGPDPAADLDAAIAASLDIAHLKTAMYTFEGPLRSGAVLAGLSDEQQDQLGTIGRNLGIAYQIEDDLLGAFGDARTIGKPVGGDFREGKPTYLVATALASEEGPRLRELLREAGNASTQSSLPTDLVAEIQDLLQRCGAQEKAVEAVCQYRSTALEVLDSASLPEDLATTLRELALMIGRDR